MSQIVADTLVRAVNPRSPGSAVPTIPAADEHALHNAAAWHRVGPAVYLLLRDGSDSPSLLGPLESAYRQQLARHLRTMADLKAAATALDSAEIDWVLIKGPALARMWPRQDMREYHDLDLLVDRHRYAEALFVLSDIGTELIDRNWPMIRKQLRAELTLRLPHGTSLDLHWDPVNEMHLRREFQFDTEEMLHRRKTIDIGSTRVPTLDPVDTLLHLGYHTTSSGAYRLLWLADIRAAAYRDLDWRQVLARAQQYHVDLPLALALDRAWRIFSPPAAHPVWPGHRGWRTVAAVADRVRPVPWTPGAGGSSRVLFQNVRRNGLRSLIPTVRDASRHGEAHSTHHAPAPNPLHMDIDDGRSRRDYFALVQGVTRP